LRFDGDTVIVNHACSEENATLSPYQNIGNIAREQLHKSLEASSEVLNADESSKCMKDISSTSLVGDTVYKIGDTDYIVCWQLRR